MSEMHMEKIIASRVVNTISRCLLRWQPCDRKQMIDEVLEGKTGLSGLAKCVTYFEH